MVLSLKKEVPTWTGACPEAPGPIPSCRTCTVAQRAWAYPLILHLHRGRAGMDLSPHAVPALWHSGQASGAFAARLSLGAAGEEDPAWRGSSPLEKLHALPLWTLGEDQGCL